MLKNHPYFPIQNVYLGGTRRKEMRKGKAELVHMLTSETISPDWNPTITSDELAAANERLAEVHMQYRWRWLNWDQKVINLCGAITLHAEALNVAA